MTVKELKEKLNEFPDSCIVCIPTINWNAVGNINYIVAQNVSIGVNEFDNVVFIDDYVEDYDDN